MQQTSMTDIDFTVLSKAQLVALVLARGDALIDYIAADKVLRQQIDAGKLAMEDMIHMEKTKEAALLKLGQVETAVVFGRPAGAVAN